MCKVPIIQHKTDTNLFKYEFIVFAIGLLYSPRWTNNKLYTFLCTVSEMQKLFMTRQNYFSRIKLKCHPFGHFSIFTLNRVRYPSFFCPTLYLGLLLMGDNLFCPQSRRCCPLLYPQLQVYPVREALKNNHFNFDICRN